MFVQRVNQRLMFKCLPKPLSSEPCFDVVQANWSTPNILQLPVGPYV